MHADRHGNGAFRRRIGVRNDARLVLAEVEDEMHHFGVAIRHDGTRVTSVEGTAKRWPWSTCPGAMAELAVLVGAPLGGPLSALARRASSEQCTHAFDLACLAVCHATTGRDAVLYDAVVPDWHVPPIQAELRRDGVVVLAWTTDGSRVLDDPAFAGADLRRGFLAWADAHLDRRGALAASVLRRVADTPREPALGGVITPLEVHPSGTGEPHGTAQPARMVVALRSRGSLRDFGRDPGAPLADWTPSGRSGPG